ncbi:Hypothetical predicted protein [Mytilus galloprovincialis]|nr:Hypothetical predicted protein [Mytilus galloprovincialis]
MLAFAICFVGYMHPFIWYRFESVQIPKEREIFQYYEDVIDSENLMGDRENYEPIDTLLSVNNENPGNAYAANAIEDDRENNISATITVNTEQLIIPPTNESLDEIANDPTCVLNTTHSL